MSYKRIIRLTEEDLHNLVRSVVHEALKPEGERMFDINKIPKEELEQQYVDFRHILAIPGYESKLFQPMLKEDLTYSVPIDEVKVEIVKRYQLKDWQFQVRMAKNSIRLGVFVPWSKSNESLIDKDMKDMGWFRSQRYKMHDPSNGRIWVEIQFEPMFQNDVNNLVRSMNYLYHVTPAYNLPNIKKEGLVPTHRNTFYNFPDRVYLLKSTTTPASAIGLAKKLKQVTPDDKKTDKYCLIAIDVSSVPVNVDFFLDPNYEDVVFTKQRIPPTAIAMTQEINI